MVYYVRKATLNDLESILEVMTDARKTLVSQDIPQWRNNMGPNEISLTKDIELAEGYVLIENKQVMGYGTVTSAPQEAYNVISEGSWLESKSYASIHRFAIHSEIKQRGMGFFFLGHLISFANTLDYDDIRIDTHPKNSRMQKVIEKVGFEYRGRVELNLENGERKAYQLKIKKE